MQDRVIGSTMPVLEVALEPGETLIAESGELSWMTSSINMTTSTQYGGGGGIGGVLKRAIGGGSLFMTEYSAQGVAGMVAFASAIPGQIFPVDVTPAGGYLVHRHGFVCSAPGIQLSVGFQKSLGAGFFSGTGFILQKVVGQGRAWFELGGEVVPYDLQAGETLRVHPNHVGLFQDSVQFGMTTVPGLKNKLFGGDGLFLAQLTGPGRVWLQSMSVARLAQIIGEYLPSAGDNNRSSGGGFGNMFGGNQ